MAWACAAGHDDDELDRRCDILEECEARILDHPAEQMVDLAIKLMVMARCIFTDHAGRDALETDARRILEGEGIKAEGSA